MVTSFEDAHLIFSRWQEDLCALRVKLVSNSLVFEATGTVAEYTHAMLQLNGPGWQFTIPIEGARFTFSDPREIPVESVRALESAKYEFGLAMELATGDHLVLLEIKDEDEDESGDPDLN